MTIDGQGNTLKTIPQIVVPVFKTLKFSVAAPSVRFLCRRNTQLSPPIAKLAPIEQIEQFRTETGRGESDFTDLAVCVKSKPPLGRSISILAATTAAIIALAVVVVVSTIEIRTHTVGPFCVVVRVHVNVR
jgi:hypothetical protein